MLALVFSIQGPFVVDSAPIETQSCSHCWLGEDGDLGFHQDKRWGGKSCSTAHPGREFVREAVFALYHARPDYVARAMDGVKKWDMLPKAANHYCACVDAAAEVPVQMP